MAAIRDEDSRKGAQFAIPDGKVALTQGRFPIDLYLSECLFSNATETEGQVTECLSPYESYFENMEGTSVPSDNWVVPAYPFDDGATSSAIGADGILRPVKSWVVGSAVPYGFDGAVYECCPLAATVCNVVPVVEEEQV